MRPKQGARGEGFRPAHQENDFVFGATLLLCAGSALVLHRVHFDYNLIKMQSQSLSSVVYEQKLMHSADRSVLFAAVIANSVQQAVDFETKVKNLPSVSGVDSVAGYFAGDHRRKLQLVERIKSELSDLRFAPIDRTEVRVQQLSPTLWYLNGYLGLAAEAAQRDDPALAASLRAFHSNLVEFRRELQSAGPEERERLTEYQQALLGQVRQTFRALQHQDTSGPLRPARSAAGVAQSLYWDHRQVPAAGLSAEGPLAA